MNETISRLAFAIQDESMTRLQAQRIARTVINTLASGDRVGRGLVVDRRTLAVCLPDSDGAEVPAEFDAG